MDSNTAPLDALRHRSDSHRLRSIAKVIDALLTDATTVLRSFSNIDGLKRAYPEWKKEKFGRCGAIKSDNVLCLWVEENGRIEVIELRRPGYPFSKHEMSLFDSFEKAMDGLFTDSRMKVSQNASRIGAKYALGNLLVAHHIRGTAASNFWTISLILDELQELALKQYEGRPCSSGFIFISQPAQQMEQIARAGFEIDAFDSDVELIEGFFEGTISHRYVDGRNSFYIIDNLRRIRGIARLADPGQYSIYDRSIFGHIDPLLEGENGRMLVAFVGRNADVIVRAKGKAIFRWNRLYWRTFDLGVMRQVLEVETELPQVEREALLACLLTCSDLRYGALALVAKNPEELPPNVGKIDDSRLSAEVVDINLRKKISQIKQGNSAIGILTSDGSTTISPDGLLLSSGDIIDLGKVPEEHLQGGGRTQAAQAASLFGLAIKVSEDGPISFFKDGRRFLQFET